MQRHNTRTCESHREFNMQFLCSRKLYNKIVKYNHVYKTGSIKYYEKGIDKVPWLLETWIHLKLKKSSSLMKVAFELNF